MIFQMWRVSDISIDSNTYILKPLKCPAAKDSGDFVQSAKGPSDRLFEVRSVPFGWSQVDDHWNSMVNGFWKMMNSSQRCGSRRGSWLFEMGVGIFFDIGRLSSLLWRCKHISSRCSWWLSWRNKSVPPPTPKHVFPLVEGLSITEMPKSTLPAVLVSPMMRLGEVSQIQGNKKWCVTCFWWTTSRTAVLLALNWNTTWFCLPCPSYPIQESHIDLRWLEMSNLVMSYPKAEQDMWVCQILP